MPVGYAPGQGDLGAVLAVLLANFHDGWVFDQLAHILARTVDFVLVAEGRIVCDVDGFAFVEVSEGVLLEPGVTFDLVVCGHDGGFFEETLELCFAEVGDADCLCLSSLQSLLHGFPCVNVVCVACLDLVVFLGNKCIASGEGRGPVHEVEV